MIQRPRFILHCINSNKHISVGKNGTLRLETPNGPIEEDALWTIVFKDSSWTLTNNLSSFHMTFQTNGQFSKVLEENKSTYAEQWVVKENESDLLLRRSCSNMINNNRTLSLQLFYSDQSKNQELSLFFFHKETFKMFCEIDIDMLNNLHLMNTKITPSIVEKYFDFVVIGSSFCALAFIQQVLKNDPNAKILLLEKGFQYLHEHRQQSSASATPDQVEFTPWSICNETLRNEYIQNVHGQIPLFGGRSNYWSGWGPTPSEEELCDWPNDLKKVLQSKYFNLANRFLGVIPANEISVRENSSIYRNLQNDLKKCFDHALGIESVQQVSHAPLAMGNDRSIKFSTPEHLSSIENVTVLFGCTIEKIIHDGRKAVSLQTTLGTISIPENGKLILAMSTLPVTTLVLNSFKDTEFEKLGHVGKRFTAHFISTVMVRVPRSHLLHSQDYSDIELGAIYIAGMKEKAQYHLQLSAVAYKECRNSNRINEICRKYSANSILQECIDISNEFVVVSCSTLGEVNFKNRNNQFYLTNDCQCLTSNGELKLQLSEQDNQLWDWMENVTFNIIKNVSISESNVLEYWHADDKTWRREIPSRAQIRSKSLVHEASTIWIGDDRDLEAPVGLDYRLRGIDNVYVTGGALWPTGGSWNPVVTIVAMAIHLADTLYENRIQNMN